MTMGMKKYMILLSALIFVACAETPKSDNTNPQQSETSVEQHEVTDINSSGDELLLLCDSIAMDSTNSMLFVRRAKAYLSREMIGEAMVDVNKALSLDKANIDAYLILSDIYYGLGDQNNITIALNKAIEMNPYDTRPMVKMAELSILQRNYPLANGYLDNALKVNRYNPKAYFVRGMLYLAQQDTTRALRSFLISREQDGSFYEPLHKIGQLYALQGNQFAEDYLRMAVKEFPEHYLSRYELALFIQDNGKPDEALAHYDTLLMVAPNNSRFLYNKGYVHFVYLSNYETALEYFDQSLANDPDYLDALYNKGCVYEKMGNYNKAKTIFSEVLQRNPNYELAIYAMNRIQNQMD